MDKTSDVLLKFKHYVYILYSLKDNNFYTGYTTDLKKRLVEHAKGFSTATKFRKPFKLIHYEYFVNEEDAKAREVFLKSGYGRDQLKKSLQNTIFFLKKQMDSPDEITHRDTVPQFE